MSGEVAVNEAGEVRVLRNGEWQAAPVAEGPNRQRVYYDGSAWQPLPGQQQASGSWWGRRTRDVIEGLAALPSAAVDAMTGQTLRRVAAPVVERMTGVRVPTTPTLSEYATAVADALNLPRPVTDEERLNSALYQGAISAIPTMGAGLLAPAGSAARAMLSGNALSQLAAGAAGGGAAEAARQAGYSEPVQLLAGLGGGLGAAGVGAAGRMAGRTAGGIAAPFTQAGREGIATDILMRGSADPENLAARVAAGLADPNARLPGATPTTGTVARDTGVLTLEQGMRSRADTAAAVGPRSPAVQFRDLEAQRNAAREAELASMADGLDPSQRGAAIRGQRSGSGQQASGLEGQQQAAQRRVSALYQAIDPNNTTAVPLAPIRESMEQAAARFYGPGSGGPPEALQGVLTEAQSGMREGLPTVTFEWLQNMRRRLGNEAGMARARGDEATASAAGAMRTALDERIAEAAASGQGFTPQQQGAWRQATAARAEMGRVFGRDETGASVVGDILRRDAFGAPRMADENIAARALASVGNLRQTIRAAGPEGPTIREALQGHFIERLTAAAQTTGQMADSAGTVTTALSPAGFARFMQQNARILPELFDPAQIQRLRRLANDFSETALATTTSNARGSPTIQNMSVGNLIARASNGLLDPGSAGLQMLGSLGGLLRPLFASSESATQALLTRAMTDPQFAQLMLARATPATVRRATAYVEQNMIGRMAGAAGTAALRQGVRTAAEQQRLQAPQ